MSEDVTLAEYLAAFSVATVEPTDEAQSMFAASLFDWAICALAGAGEQAARITRDLAEHEGGLPEATLIGSDRLVPARTAAMVNGTTSHALDYDDTHFAHIGHPSVAVIPAALAAAESEGADMDAFRRAALLGMEASIRTGVWLGRGHYQAGFHQTATAGAVGATLAACRLMGLPESDAAHAFGLVSTRASGLKSQFGSMGKPFNAGIAASNGVESALLARRGFEAALSGLDGDQGLSATHHGAGDESAFDEMGQTWLFETVSHKFHACCHGLHAMLEAMSAIEIRDVATVRIETHPRWATVCNIESPATGLEAKFSYRLAAAMSLSGVSTASLQAYAPEIASRPDIVALRDKVTVQFTDALTETQARVEVRSVSDETQIGHHDLMDPIQMDRRLEKLRTKGEALLGGPLSSRIWEATQSNDLRDLTKLFRV